MSRSIKTYDAPEKNSTYSHLEPELRCAYHPKQSITNFCKCEECLLPVCPTCIKVHTDEHKLNQTTPKFQQIHRIITEIKESYFKLNDLVEEIKNYLVDIEGNRKHNEAEIRQKMVESRQILIKQFQSSLIAMENKLMEQIVTVDEQFIRNIGSVDDQLNNIKQNVNKGMNSLETDDILKHIIIHYGKHTEEKYYAELSTLKKQSSELTKSALSIQIRPEELHVIERAVERYIRLEISSDMTYSPNRMNRK